MIKISTENQVAIDQSFVLIAKRFFQTKAVAFPPKKKEARELIDFYNTELGFDKFLTRLKRLPYQSFSGIKNGEDLYIKAVTKEMIVDYKDPRRNRNCKFNIGAYNIYVKESHLLRGNIIDCHFVPQKQLLIDPENKNYRATHYRHLHHKASYDPDRCAWNNPLSYNPVTCWGTFGSMIPAVAQDGDLAELFRAFYLFLFVQNPSSPLVRLSDLQHYEEVHLAN